MANNKKEKIVPPGFRFRPSDEVLISCYLLPKIMKSPEWDIIPEKHLYNAAPWDAFGDGGDYNWEDCPDGNTNKKITYVFTKLTKKAKKKKMMRRRKNRKMQKEQYVRKAGCGTWDGQTGPKVIRDVITNEIIGSKKMLVFEIIDDTGLSPDLINSCGYWTMHEYSVDYSDYVLCQITREGSKNSKIKPPKAPNSRRGRRNNINVAAADAGTSSSTTTTTTTRDDNYLIQCGPESEANNFRGSQKSAVVVVDNDCKKLEAPYSRRRNKINVADPPPVAGTSTTTATHYDYQYLSQDNNLLQCGAKSEANYFCSGYNNYGGGPQIGEKAVVVVVDNDCKKFESSDQFWRRPKSDIVGDERLLLNAMQNKQQVWGTNIGCNQELGVFTDQLGNSAINFNVVDNQVLEYGGAECLRRAEGEGAHLLQSSYPISSNGGFGEGFLQFDETEYYLEVDQYPNINWAPSSSADVDDHGTIPAASSNYSRDKQAPELGFKGQDNAAAYHHILGKI